MASKASMLGDPRRPGEVRKYKRAPPDDEAPAMLLLLGMLCGMGAMALRAKLLAWAALFVAAACANHAKSESTDYRQVVMIFTFALMGLLNAYFMPPPPGPAQRAPAPMSPLVDGGQ